MARYQTVIAGPELTSPFDRTLNTIRSLTKHGTDRTINNSLTILVSAIRSIPDPASVPKAGSGDAPNSELPRGLRRGKGLRGCPIRVLGTWLAAAAAGPLASGGQPLAG